MAAKRLLIFSLFLCLISLFLCSNISSSSSSKSVQDDRISVEEHYKLRCPTDHTDSEVALEGSETHVVVLKQSNFSEFVVKNRFVIVEFCAPLSYLCEEFAPDYAAAATELKDEAVALAKVDAIEEAELVQKFDVQGFPTILFFVNGVHKPYSGERNKDAIVTWLKEKIGSGLQNIKTAEDAERLLAGEEKIVLGYLESLVVNGTTPNGTTSSGLRNLKMGDVGRFTAHDDAADDVGGIKLLLAILAVICFVFLTLYLIKRCFGVPQRPVAKKKKKVKRGRMNKPKVKSKQHKSRG